MDLRPGYGLETMTALEINFRINNEYIRVALVTARPMFRLTVEARAGVAWGSLGSGGSMGQLGQRGWHGAAWAAGAATEAEAAAVTAGVGPKTTNAESYRLIRKQKLTPVSPLVHSIIHFRSALTCL